jgi:hypothetical protein
MEKQDARLTRDEVEMSLYLFQVIRHRFVCIVHCPCVGSAIATALLVQFFDLFPDHALVGTKSAVFTKAVMY